MMGSEVPSIGSQGNSRNERRRWQGCPFKNIDYSSKQQGFTILLRLMNNRNAMITLPEERRCTGSGLVCTQTHCNDDHSPPRIVAM
jgi:hypothetical protein